jgi:hypothetical protein
MAGTTEEDSLDSPKTESPRSNETSVTVVIRCDVRTKNSVLIKTSAMASIQCSLKHLRTR